MRAIDSDALKEEIDYYIREAGWGETRNEALRWCLEFIDNQPTIEPERKKGKWIDICGNLRCSECNIEYPDLYPDYDETNFCPNYGADMREEN